MTARNSDLAPVPTRPQLSWLDLRPKVRGALTLAGEAGAFLGRFLARLITVAVGSAVASAVALVFLTYFLVDLNLLRLDDAPEVLTRALAATIPVVAVVALCASMLRDAYQSQWRIAPIVSMHREERVRIAVAEAITAHVMGYRIAKLSAAKLSGEYLISGTRADRIPGASAEWRNITHGPGGVSLYATPCIEHLADTLAVVMAGGPNGNSGDPRTRTIHDLHAQIELLSSLRGVQSPTLAEAARRGAEALSSVPDEVLTRLERELAVAGTISGPRFEALIAEDSMKSAPYIPTRNEDTHA